MMTSDEWARVERTIEIVWHRSKWPAETRLAYRAKLQGFPEVRVLGAIDELSGRLRFLPTIAEILKLVEPTGCNLTSSGPPGREPAIERQRKSETRWAVEWIEWADSTGGYKPEVDRAWGWLRACGMSLQEAAASVGYRLRPGRAAVLMPGGSTDVEPGWSG